MFASPPQNTTADKAVEPSARYELRTVRYVNRHGYGTEVPVPGMADDEIRELILALLVYKRAIVGIIDARLEALRREQLVRLNAAERGAA